MKNPTKKLHSDRLKDGTENGKNWRGFVKKLNKVRDKFFESAAKVIKD